MSCRKGKSESKGKAGEYRCSKCGANSKQKKHLCKPKKIKDQPNE